MKVTGGYIGKVDVYFDYASPWSYLASEIAARKLSGIEVVWRPIYLRGLELFSKGVPYDGSKLAYFVRDLSRCCEHEGVALVPPAVFPVDGLHALRAAIVAERRGVFPRYHEAAFRAVWRDQKDVSRKDVVAAILADALGEPTEDPAALEALVASFSAPDVKEQLKAQTAAAIERGVFGVPSFFVGDDMFWGHDRMDYVARAVQKTR